MCGWRRQFRCGSLQECIDGGDCVDMAVGNGG